MACLAPWRELFVLLHHLSTDGCAGLAAETVESLIAGAKKEEEITFIAGAQTFGGRKGLADLETAFNRRFGLKMQHQLRGGAGHECASGAPYHRDQVGTQSLVGYLSRFAIAPGIDARGKRSGESQLRRALSLGDQGDGNFSQRSRAGLHVAQRHRLQRQLGSERQSAEKLCSIWWIRA